jgi:hypothetical protein
VIQRVVRKTEIGPKRIRYRVLITGDSCPPHTHEARIHQHLFLQWVAENQAMLQCGYSIPEKIAISHNGTCWQAECEAEVDEVDA